MASTRQQIIADMTAYMRKHGSASAAWYVGVSKDARDRLFGDHCVREEGDAWIFRQATTAREAREVESHFLDVVGTAGGPGGGDHTADMVYAYRKASHTDP